MLKQVLDTSPSRPKFNLLHQRNSPLRLDPGTVTRLKTWKNYFLRDFIVKHGYFYDKFSIRRYKLLSETFFFLGHFLSPDRGTKF